MENTETNNEQITKTQIGARVDPAVFAAIEKIANEEERTISNTVERLLRNSPRVQEIMEPATAGVSA